MKISLKEIGYDKLILLFIAGVILVITSIPVNKGSSGTQEKAEENISTYGNYGTYEEYLEAELEEILADVQGAGNVKVMITLKETREKIVLCSYEQEEESLSEGDSEGGSRDSYSYISNQEYIYEGDVPYVVKEVMPKIEGVIVVCEGGDNAVVTDNITKAVEAVLPVSPSNVKVLKMK